MLINDASITGSLIVNASASFQNISVGGNIIPDETNIRNLGSTDKYFKEIYVSTGSINFVDETGVVGTLNAGTITAIQSNTSSANSRLDSVESVSASLQSFTASIFATNTFTSSATARLNALETTSASVDTLNTTQNNRLGSLETISASNISRISALETTSASVDTLNTTQNSRLTSLEIKTGSLATTGSNTFIGTQTITGSLFISANLVVQGTSSLENITASAVSIGTNIVNLNTANPAIRYAGLVIGDSGSVGGSGSFLYDSVQDEMIFVHRGASNVVTSSVVLMGPQTFDTIGIETYPTNNRIQKGTGNEHLVDSCISDTGTLVTINSPTSYFSGSVGIGINNPNNLLHLYGTDGNSYLRWTSDVATTGTRIGYNGSEFRIDQQQNADITFRTNGSERMRVTSGGLVSINQTCSYGVFNVTGIDCAWGEGIVMNPAPNGYSAINFRAEGRTGACFTGTWQLGKISSGETSSGEVFSITRQGTTGGKAYRVDASQQWKTNGDSIFGFNVGIGTTTPDALLTTDGQIANFSTGTLARFHASKGTAEGAYLQIAATRHSTQSVRRVEFYAYDGASCNANIVLQPNGGCLGIGTYTPGQTLAVQGNSYFGCLSNTLNFSQGGNDRFLEVGAGSGGDALFVAHSSGYGVAYFGYEASNDRLVIATDCGSGANKIDFILNAGTTTGGTADNLSTNPLMRITAGGNVLVGTNSTCKGLLRVAGNAEICKTLFFNGGDGNGGAIINTSAAVACATPAYNLISMFGFNTMTNYGAYLFIHTGYNTVTTKNSTITGIVNNGANQTISILATTMDSGATAPSVHSTSNWSIAFCWPNPANSNTKFIALAG